MNYKDPKIQIIAFVIMLFLVASYFWFSKSYTVNADKIASLKIQYEKELVDLHSVKQKAATLDDLQRELDDLQIKYKNVELLLPEIKEDEAFLSQIHAAAQVTGSTVLELTPMGAQPVDFYTANIYSLQVESSYHGLGNFFARVANFPFIVNVSDLEMKSLNGGGAKALNKGRDADNDVIATFKMSTYNAKQDAAG
jgi:type IV pilus assembly protein PilO